MSSDAQDSSSRKRWRAPVTGALAGLAVSAALIGPSALASKGGDHATRKTASPAAAGAAAGGPSSQFFAAVAAAVRAGTIDDAQARVLDRHIQAGSIDPKALVDSGALTAAQMQAVSDRLVAVKRRLARQAQSGSAEATAPCNAKKAGRRTG